VKPSAAPNRADPAPTAGAIGREYTIFDVGRAGDAGAQSHYADPLHYAHTYGDRRHDIDYYVRLARRSGGPMLEYGVGNGRIALHVARAGVQVEGVDLSRPMLDDFARRLANEPKSVRARVKLHHGDMREVRLEQRFPLVIAPFNAFLHLYDRRDVEAFLEGVRSHLLPSGNFAFDFSVPQPEDLARSPDRDYAAPDLVDPTTNEPVRYSERFEYDPLRQLLLVRMRYTPAGGAAAARKAGGGRSFEIPLTHRQFFPREMEALLHYNGFEHILFTADFTDQPADRSVDSIVVSCRAKV
jgi:SAM-dependent methyltransferase